MENLKHTKGQWEINNNGLGMCRIQTHKDNPLKTNNICSLAGDGTTEEVKANAKLISASPELLEALLIAHDIIALRHAERPELIQIKNAIKKATE